MRTRARFDMTRNRGTDPISISTAHWGPGWIDDGTTSQSQPDRLVEQRESIIVDDPSPGRGVKNCSHSVRKYVYNDIPEIITYDFNVSTGVPETDKHIRTGKYVFQALNGLFSLPGFSNVDVTYKKSDAALIREACHNFYNQTEVDNLVNITEAGQLVSKSAVQAGNKRLGSIYQSFHDLPFMLAAKEIRHKVPSLIFSKGYLYYSFGLAPLLSDLRKMAKSYKSIAPAMKKTLSRRNKTSSYRSYSAGSISLNSDGLAFYDLPDSPGGGYRQQFVSYKSPIKICTVRGKHSSGYTEDSTFARLDYLAQRFLTAGPASFLWEKVPFSFVLDWFVDSSALIDKLDNVLTGNKKQIVDVCLSETWSILVSVYAKPREGRFNSSFGQNVANVELSKYTRSPVSPDTSPGLSGRFGQKQMALSAALLHQMVANLKKKAR